MPYQQRDIVRVKRALPNGTLAVHPFLIISCESTICQEKERFYVGVMLTHSKQKDMFTFSITKDMIDGSWKDEWSQIRLYIIASFRESDIGKDSGDYLGSMKKPHFKAVLQQIKDYVLSPD